MEKTYENDWLTTKSGIIAIRASESSITFVVPINDPMGLSRTFPHLTTTSNPDYQTRDISVPRQTVTEPLAFVVEQSAQGARGQFFFVSRFAKAEGLEIDSPFVLPEYAAAPPVNKGARHKAQLRFGLQ